jgi:hypothetical protein
MAVISYDRGGDLNGATNGKTPLLGKVAQSLPTVPVAAANGSAGGGGGGPPPTLLGRLLVCLQYGLVSVAITLFNRAVFSVYHFNFPSTVTLLQILVSLVYMYGLRATGRMQFGALSLRTARKVSLMGEGAWRGRAAGCCSLRAAGALCWPDGRPRPAEVAVALPGALAIPLPPTRVLPCPPALPACR